MIREFNEAYIDYKLNMIEDKVVILEDSVKEDAEQYSVVQMFFELNNLGKIIQEFTHEFLDHDAELNRDDSFNEFIKKFDFGLNKFIYFYGNLFNLDENQITILNNYQSSMVKLLECILQGEDYFTEHGHDIKEAYVKFYNLFIEFV